MKDPRKYPIIKLDIVTPIVDVHTTKELPKYGLSSFPPNNSIASTETPSKKANMYNKYLDILFY